jgi:16S rRNA (cytosine1402-N4)-methyltransferase
MRMDATQGETAADLVNTLSEEALADILRRYGEEKRAKALARAIVAARPILRTRELAEIAERVLGRGAQKIHPATRTFQALRIAVNDELDELLNGLIGATSLLKPGGQLVVVTFHSLEDRIAKRFLQGNTGREQPISRHLPTERSAQRAFAPIFGQITPGATELASNPRARSAKLRWGTRTHSPVPEGFGEALLRPEPARRRRRK